VLTLIAGLRESHFTTPGAGTEAGMVQNATDPRFGVAIRVPHLNWVFHGFYGHFYQPPPLLTATVHFARSGHQPDSDFRTLKEKRDEEYQFGVSIPFMLGA